MILDCDNLAVSSIYKLMTTLITPRPIAWVSTISKDNKPNLAPFSFFNIIGHDPPFVMVSCVNTNFKLKDTAQNIMDTREFVVNMVTLSNLEPMNTTAGVYLPEENEFELAELTPIDSIKVKPPLILESPVSMECSLEHQFCLNEGKTGGSTSFVGRIKVFHIDDNMIDDSLKIDTNKYDVLGKMSNQFYCKPNNDVAIKRP